MDSKELRQVYGDIYTLDRPVDGEASEFFRHEPDEGTSHPLDTPGVAESGHNQGWGN